jgi:hypothetical protein
VAGGGGRVSLKNNVTVGSCLGRAQEHLCLKNTGYFAGREGGWAGLLSFPMAVLVLSLHGTGSEVLNSIQPANLMRNFKFGFSVVDKKFVLNYTFTLSVLITSINSC